MHDPTQQSRVTCDIERVSSFPVAVDIGYEESLFEVEDVAAENVEDETLASPRPIKLGQNSNVVACLLTVPLYVLNPRVNDKATVARDTGELFYSWNDKGQERGFVFKRPKGIPFPLPEHAELFYTLLAMFATRFNETGNVYFRLIDIVKNAGKSTKSNSAYERVREMIWRYSQCTVAWDAGWRFKRVWQEGQEDQSTWGGPLILAQNIFAAKTTTQGGLIEARKIIADNRATNSYRWYSIVLHPAVVAAVRDQLVRRFLTQSLQNRDLSDTTKCIYRYFNGFNNLSYVKRSYDQLMQAFAYKSAKSKFKIWLLRHLDELERSCLIESYECKDDYVAVKCAPISSLEKNTMDVDQVDHEPVRNERRSRASITMLEALSDKDLLRMRADFLAAGVISDDDSETIQSMARVDVKIAAQTYRNHLSGRWGQIGSKVVSLIKEIRTRESKIAASAAKERDQSDHMAPRKPRIPKASIERVRVSDQQGLSATNLTQILEAFGGMERDLHGNLILSPKAQQLLNQLVIEKSVQARP